KYPQAVEALQQALALGEEIKAPAIVWKARYHLAGAYEKLGDRTQALYHYRLAIDTIERVRAQANSDEGKFGFLESKIVIYESLIRLLHQRDRENPAAGYSRDAFQYAERAKARCFLDRLEESRVGMHIQADTAPELLAKERELEIKLSTSQLRL